MTTPERFGRYRLIKRMATGGMGELFLARHRSAEGIERLIVLKRILPHLTKDPDFVAYFVSEGRIASLLNHPNVVQTYEVGRVGEAYYIAMEYVPGPSLVKLLATAAARGLRLSIPLVMHLAMGIGRALEYVHERRDIEGRPLGIIHMDLAPHNVLVGHDGHARLLDFGIARVEGTPYPRRRDFRGRTAYLAPEQLDGMTLDQRVDLFAYGVMLYEMLSGGPLFRSHTEQQTVTRILRSRIPPPRTVRRDCPPALEEIIMRALSRDRDERYVSARDVLVELDDCAVKHQIVSPQTQLRLEIDGVMRAGEMERRAESVGDFGYATTLDR